METGEFKACLMFLISPKRRTIASNVRIFALSPRPNLSGRQDEQKLRGISLVRVGRKGQNGHIFDISCLLNGLSRSKIAKIKIKRFSGKNERFCVLNKEAHTNLCLGYIVRESLKNCLMIGKSQFSFSFHDIRAFMCFSFFAFPLFFGGTRTF